MSVFANKPKLFFELLIHDVGRAPGFTAPIAGYEGKLWRNEAIADYLFEWLPEFALKYSDLEDLNSATAVRLIRKAAKVVYSTEKYKARGEFGELLLHALIREIFNSEPVISKIFYKSAINDTVKGFDAVHLVTDGSSLQLWLGEVKFYTELRSAINHVITELHNHTARDYLRDEFVLIDSKIDPRWKHAAAVRDLISERTSLDQVFSCICIPVLLTYDSDTAGKHDSSTNEFQLALKDELESAYSSFVSGRPPDLKIHLFLVPLRTKKELVEILHRKLEGLQR